MKRQPWFERVFPHGLPPPQLPLILERLRGTPARLEDRLLGVPREVVTCCLDGTWSAQQNAGHLLDLEPLWLSRLEEVAARKRELGAADLSNRRTHEANHNDATLGTLLTAFRDARRSLVRRLETFSESQLNTTALHPRLKVPMNVVDLAFFVAEHDDYHLARITELLRDVAR
jgi:uncharacterized damage-inducible protein DinB